MSKKNKNEKYCPTCKSWLPIVKFAEEGKNRFDKNGDKARRRICSSCVWKQKKMKKQAEKQSKEEIFQSLVTGLIELSRHDLDRLKFIDELNFVLKTNAHEVIRDFDFDDITLIRAGIIFVQTGLNGDRRIRSRERIRE